MFIFTENMFLLHWPIKFYFIKNMQLDYIALANVKQANKPYYPIKKNKLNTLCGKSLVSANVRANKEKNSLCGRALVRAKSEKNALFGRALVIRANIEKNILFGRALVRIRA